MHELNIPEVIRFWARWSPGAVHLQEDGRTRTWAQLNSASNRWANALAARCVEQGDRLGILAHNSIEFCEAVMGALRLGAVVVPLNVRLGSHELSFILSDAECRLVLCDTAHEDVLKRALEIVEVATATWTFPEVGTDGAIAIFADETDPDRNIDSEDVAYLGYTSGTTGFPKGSMISHRSVWFAGIGTGIAYGLTYEDSLYLCLPLAFFGSLVSAWAPTLLTGGRVVLDQSFDPRTTLETIERERITFFGAVPSVWQALFQHPEFGKRDLSSLRLAVTGAAPVPFEDLRVAQRAGLPMAQGYGLTEGGARSTALQVANAEAKLGSAGVPLMHTQVAAADADLQPLPPGEPGEIIIKGPGVMNGYWRNESATAETLVNGWLRTGDVGITDDDGYVTIIDRAKDMIISGGLNVYPAEIESVLSAVPTVMEAAVIGAPDEHWGEMPVAIVRIEEGAPVDAATLLQECRDKLADYKVPRRVIFRSEPLPRGHSEKVQKRELRNEYISSDTSSA